MASSSYIYPHIEFTQSTVGNIPPISSWRNRIGVVGQFRRGPALANITGIKDFTRLFGGDNSPGAKAVRQMLDLGASNITIARAVSQESPATIDLKFYSLIDGVEARIGYEGNVQQFNDEQAVQTTGIQLDAEYIGEAVGSLGSFGNIEVSSETWLNPNLSFSGQSLINLSVEDRITNTVTLSTNSGLSGASSAYLTTSPVNLALGVTGTLASLNALLNPQLGAPALVSGDKISFADNGYITITGTTYTVVRPINVASGSVVFKVENLQVANVLSTLGVGSKLYRNNVEVGTVVERKTPTNTATTLSVISTGGAAIPSGSILKAQALIGSCKLSLRPTISNEFPYQFAKISKRDYPAVVANISPGKRFKLSGPGATLPSGWLEVLSRPLSDPTNSDVYRIIVKGVVNGNASDLANGIDFNLYDTAENAYVISVSTEANLKLKAEPNAVHWRNELYQESTKTLVDSYVIVNEAYQPNNLQLDILFVLPNQDIISIDSGIVFEVKDVENSGLVAFTIGSNFRIPLIKSSVKIGALSPFGTAFPIGTAASDILRELGNALATDSLMNLLFEPPVLSETLNPPTLTFKTRINGPQANRVNVRISRSTSGEDSINGFFANDILLNQFSNTPGYEAQKIVGYWSKPNEPTPILNISYLKGGSFGARAATLDLYSADSDLLVRLVALSDGAYGNQIQISVAPGSNGQFVINATDRDSESYLTQPLSETLNLSTRDVDASSGLFNATSNSLMIRAYYVPIMRNANAQLTDLELNKVPLRVAPAFGQTLTSLNFTNENGKPSIYSSAHQGSAYLQQLYLQGGADAALEPDATPTTIGATALVRAVQRLEAEDIAILYPAGVIMGDPRYARVVEECVGQVKRNADLATNRRLILQAPPNLNQNQANLYSAQLNSSDITLVAGFCSYNGLSTSNTEPVAPIYAATLALIEPPQSPAYARNGVTISLVRSVDTPNTPQYLDALSRAGVEALFFDTGLNQFHFLNGLTTSRDPANRHVSIRRVDLQMMADMYVNLLYIRSSQNDSNTRALIASSCDAYLTNRVAVGWIKSHRPTVCDESNNDNITAAQGRLNARISYTPYFPSDIIGVDVVQDLNVEITN